MQDDKFDQLLRAKVPLHLLTSKEIYTELLIDIYKENGMKIGIRKPFVYKKFPQKNLNDIHQKAAARYIITYHGE